MTDVVFYKNNGVITAFECSGHTGYAEAGYDIVCSALSSIAQSCALGIKEVLKINAKIKRNDDKGYYRVALPNDMTDSQAGGAQVLLKTMLCSVKALAKEYSKYIKLEEREVC